MLARFKDLAARIAIVAIPVVLFLVAAAPRMRFS
jgi:hypothetical protein